jgi:hypothetical protein
MLYSLDDALLSRLTQLYKDDGAVIFYHMKRLDAMMEGEVPSMAFGGAENRPLFIFEDHREVDAWWDKYR